MCIYDAWHENRLDELMLAQYSIESKTSSCCNNKLPPVFFLLYIPYNLYDIHHFLLSTPPLPLYLLHNLPHICHLSLFPLSFSIYPSKDTSTGSLSSSCWLKFKMSLYKLLINIKAKKLTVPWPSGMCLMKSSGTKLMVISFSKPVHVSLSQNCKYTRACVYSQSTFTFHLVVHLRACASKAGPQSPVADGGVSRKR